MKTFTTCCLLSGLLVASSGCQKDNGDPVISTESCVPFQQPVKVVTDVEGTVGFHAMLQQYFIQRTIPGTYDSVDFGLLCGTVPTSLQVVGKKVRFSGTYKPYDKPRPAGPVGGTFYYLEVSKAVVQ
jgi:hypothetical protein